MYDYLYIVQIREFVIREENVYKVGRTNDIFRRMSQYPKNSKLLCVLPTKNAVGHERVLLHTLCTKFKNRRDIGAEYFEGSLQSIMNVMYKVVSNLNSQSTDIRYVDASMQTGVDDNQENPFEKYKISKT